MAQGLRYLLVNKGISWKKILVAILITVVILTVLNTDYFSNEVCLYKPSKTHYALRLRPKPYKVPVLEDDDYQKLINFNKFKFKLIGKQTCTNFNVFLLVLISTTPKNFKRRQTIRTTWGKNDAKVKTFFMLGAVNDPNLQKKLEEENESYGDIVQGNFIDSYRNLTYKTVMALKYVVYHCTSATYILKTDDDIFVNMPLMKNFLTNDMSPFGAENYLHCHEMKNKPIYRYWSKWAVTEAEFPGKKYPTYCMGPYAIFSPDVLFKLYKEAQKTKYFFIEDVFLYGVAAGKYPDIIPMDISDLSLWNYYPNKVSEGVFDNINFLIGTLEMNDEYLIEFWNYVMSRPVRSSVYDYTNLKSE